MDRDQLSRGYVYDETLNLPYDRILHLSGMPKRYWVAKREQLAFATFKQNQKWASIEKDKDLGAFTFRKETQMAAYDAMLAEFTETGSAAAFSGEIICATSHNSDFMACRMAAVACHTLLAANEAASIYWHDTCQMRFEREVVPRWAALRTPDLVILTGLHPRPTPEHWESVKRWTEWATRYAPCILVGSDEDPIKMSVYWYGILPDRAFFGRPTFMKTTEIG